MSKRVHVETESSEYDDNGDDGNSGNNSNRSSKVARRDNDDDGDSNCVKKDEDNDHDCNESNNSSKQQQQQTRNDEEEEGGGGGNELTSTNDDDGIDPSFMQNLVSKKSSSQKARKSACLPFENLYLDNLPTSEGYERSFMHKELITHVVSASKTEFIITGSVDGAIKFWKKQQFGIEFVKHFRAHTGRLQDIACDVSSKLLATVANDKTLKVFDIVNFDMINMIKLKFQPGKCIWIYSPGDAIQAIAVADAESPKIYIYDSAGGSKPLRILDEMHLAPITTMAYNVEASCVISVDKTGMLAYWCSPQLEYVTPGMNIVNFDSKLDTDLYDFAKNKAIVHDICFSPDGRLFASISSDRKIRIFSFVTGKLIRMYDETLQHCSALQNSTSTQRQLVPNMEFGRRMAIERELEKLDQLRHERIIFDQSGYFILYPTMFGIKMVNWYTNRCSRILGKGENLRPLCISLFQNINSRKNAALTVDMIAADNPNLEDNRTDPCVFTTAFKKNRFYIFSKRDPEDASGEESVIERDVYNEKPTREDMIASTETGSIARKIYDSCIMHTSMGDIHLKLFAKECPKTVENFCVHAKNGYYNGHIFHRVISQFMIQTGDPTGTGTGGTSIYGGEFEDEFHADLRHDKPYTLSMANCGANTNGSQFFVTVIPCPWLDNKHTVFGRVTKGMEVVQNISKVKTNPKTSKPYDDVKIVSISLK